MIKNHIISKRHKFSGRFLTQVLASLALWKNVFWKIEKIEKSIGKSCVKFWQYVLLNL